MTFSVVNYSEWPARQALDHPILNPKGKRLKRIGRGAFAIVYQSPNPKRVLKVTADAMAYYLHTDPVAKCTGKYFPKVFNDYGQIGSFRIDRGEEVALYMVELEKLKPARVPAHKVCAAIPQYAYDKLEEFKDLMGGPRYVQTDLHSQNVMRRYSTGELVLSDPVADKQLLRGSLAW